MSVSLASLLFSPAGQGFDLFQGKDSNILSQGTGENFQQILTNILQSQNSNLVTLQSEDSNSNASVNFQQLITSILNQQQNINPSSFKVSANGSVVSNEYNSLSDVLSNTAIGEQTGKNIVQAIEQLLVSQKSDENSILTLNDLQRIVLDTIKQKFGAQKFFSLNISNQLNTQQNESQKSALTSQNITTQNNPLLSAIENAGSIQLTLITPENVSIKNNKIQLPIQVSETSDNNEYVLELPVHDLMNITNRGEIKDLTPILGHLIPVNRDESSSNDASTIGITVVLPMQLIEALQQIIQPAPLTGNESTGAVGESKSLRVGELKNLVVGESKNQRVWESKNQGIEESGSLKVEESESLGSEEFKDARIKIDNYNETTESTKIAKDTTNSIENTLQTVQDGAAISQKEELTSAPNIQEHLLKFTFKLDPDFGLAIFPVSGTDLPVTQVIAENVTEKAQTDGLKTLFEDKRPQVNSFQLPDVLNSSIISEVMTNEGTKVQLPEILQVAFEKTTELKDAPKLIINSSYLKNIFSMEKSAIPESLIVPAFLETIPDNSEVNNFSAIAGKTQILETNSSNGNKIQEVPIAEQPFVGNANQVTLPVLIKVSRAVIEFIQSNPDLQRSGQQEEAFSKNNISDSGNEVIYNQKTSDYPVSLLNDVAFMIPEYSSKQSSINQENTIEPVTDNETYVSKNPLRLQREYIPQQYKINFSGISPEQTDNAQVNIGENKIFDQPVQKYDGLNNLWDILNTGKYDDLKTLPMHKNILKSISVDQISGQNDGMDAATLNKNLLVDVWGKQTVDSYVEMKPMTLNSKIPVNTGNVQTMDGSVNVMSLESNPGNPFINNVLQNDAPDISVEKNIELDSMEEPGRIKIINKKLIVNPRIENEELPVSSGADYNPLQKKLQWNTAGVNNNIELPKNTIENAATNIKSDIQDGETKTGKHIQNLPDGIHPLSAKESSDSGKLFTEHLARSSRVIEQNIDPLIQRVKYMAKEGITDLQMDLNPPDLGKIHIRVTSEQSEMIARIGVESHSIKALFDEQLPKLQESLQNNGVTIQRLDVYVRDDGGESARFAFEKSQYGERRNQYNQQSSKSVQNAVVPSVNTVFKSRGYNSWELVV